MTTHASGSRRWHLSTKIENARSKKLWLRTADVGCCADARKCSPSPRHARASPAVQLLSADFKSSGADQAMDSKQRECAGLGTGAPSTSVGSSFCGSGGASVARSADGSELLGADEESGMFESRGAGDDESAWDDGGATIGAFGCGFPVEFHARMPPISAPSAPATMSNRDPEGITVSLHHGTARRERGEGTLVPTRSRPSLPHMRGTNAGPCRRAPVRQNITGEGRVMSFSAGRDGTPHRRPLGPLRGRPPAPGISKRERLVQIIRDRHLDVTAHCRV
jgi:hypothetical protein